MEVAQNRFPFPSFLSPIELVTYIANLPAPTLSDEYQWSEELKDFLKIWYGNFFKSFNYLLFFSSY